MNSLKLQLENFQSITHGELEFKTGLNFIIGQSNSGKSATFRALKACLLNPSGSQRFIKNGYTALTVTLSYNDNVITWKKTSKENSYTVNGEEYVKTGRANAFKLIENTGFVQGESEAIMNIEEELQLPFPFGLSKSEFFKLYENIFCVSDSATILKSAKEHENKVKFDLDLLEVELNKNKIKLQELEAFKKELDLNDLKKRLDDCKKLNNRLILLKDGTEIIQLAVRASEIQIDVTPINTKNRVPTYRELISLKSLVNKVKQYHQLSKTLPIPIGVSSEKLIALKDKKDLKALAIRTQVLSDIKVEGKEFSNKLLIFQEKQELQKIIIQLRALHGIHLSVVEFKDKLSQYKELLKYKTDLNEIQKKAASKKATLQGHQELLKHLQEKLKEYKVCPLCHRPLED